MPQSVEFGRLVRVPVSTTCHRTFGNRITVWQRIRNITLSWCYNLILHKAMFHTYARQLLSNQWKLFISQLSLQWVTEKGQTLDEIISEAACLMSSLEISSSISAIISTTILSITTSIAIRWSWDSVYSVDISYNVNSSHTKVDEHGKREHNFELLHKIEVHLNDKIAP